MIKYRKTDQQYIDDYDRHTIEWLKKLEKESTVPIYLENKIDHLEISDSYNPVSLFYEMAVKSAQGKEETIRKRKQEDENRDWLLEKTIAPKNIKCKICDSLMNVCSHTFEDNDAKLLFFFECPNGHFPRRLIHSNGREEFLRGKSCKKCGHSIESKTRKTKKTLFITDTCNGCGDVQKCDLDLVIKPVKPIDEKERKKYCTDFIGRNTLEQDMIVLANLHDYLKEHTTNEQKEKINGVDKIEKLTLPKMENKLAKDSDASGYCKFNFEKPETGKYFIVPFSVQDPSDRPEKDSVKELVRCINKSVFPTIWRLMSTQITYRLGLLSGKLKAYEDEEGLIKIGQEILAKTGAFKT